MKNLTLVSALIFAIVFASQAQTGNNYGQVLPSTQNSFKIIYTKSGNANVKIKLRDENGSMIRIDKVASTDGFMKRYDLSQLEPGLYSFEVLDKSNRSVHKVNVSENSGVSVIAAYDNDTSMTIVSEQNPSYGSSESKTFLASSNQ